MFAIDVYKSATANISHTSTTIHFMEVATVNVDSSLATSVTLVATAIDVAAHLYLRARERARKRKNCCYNDS